jgi:Flp pilus assembly protein TadG
VARERRTERGIVTAELALAIPLLLALTLGLVWLLSLATAQVRLVDAARETARVAARGDGVEVAIERGGQVAPAGARISVATDGDAVVASGEVEIDGVGGLLEVLPSVRLTATAVSAREGPAP